MPFSISEFSSNLNRYGVVKPSNYTIAITKTFSPEAAQEQQMLFRCTLAELPGRQVLTADRRVYGPTERMGVDLDPGSLTIGIVLSENLSEKDYFDRWIDLMIGKYRTATTIDTNRFEIGYYDNYVGTAQIIMYNDIGQATYKVDLVDVYPKGIGQVQLSWQNGSEITILPINLYYRYYVSPDLTLGIGVNGHLPPVGQISQTPPTVASLSNQVARSIPKNFIL